jgi:hypothetical protein
MERIETEIVIAATAQRVWRTLVHFEAYPEWNPFVRWVKGSATTGSQLVVRIEPPGQGGMTFRPRVLKADPGRELRWLGSLGVRGLFDGEHSFIIEPLGPETVVFHQSETFRGLLVPLLARRLQTSTRAGFEEMNRALKQRAEQTSQ